ncbi:MAG: OmpA family protein [Ignavibacteria bacterium]|nr:OmpA family protein [Ignavibacteria bacterium]
MNFYYRISLLFLSIQSIIYSQRDLETITDEEDLKQFIYQTAPSDDALVAVQRLAKPYIDKKDFSNAAKVFMKYREWFIDKYLIFDKIIEMLNSPYNQPEVINIQAINSRYDEYFPSLTIDGKKIYFTFVKDSKKGEEIYYSLYDGNIWSKPQNIGRPFSTSENDAINSVSADGNVLVLFGSYAPHQGGGDNYYAEKTESGWSEIKPFPKPLNSKYWDCDGFLTADGKAFLFTSDRPGGVGEFVRGGQFYHGGYEGNTDIWVSVKTDKGWDKPVNLGKVINTPFAERSPFLHPDGKTLYFSSDGHYGLGSLDVFKSVRLSDTSWTDWSEPVNLGKEINTSGMDIAYKITTDGKYAYFSSDRPGGKGGYDIYYIKLPPDVMPQRKVVIIKGRVTDENERPLSASIKWYDLTSGLEAGVLNSDPESGDYIISLPEGKTYSYFAEKENHFSVSNTIDLSGYSEPEIFHDIKMYSVKYLQDKTIRLNNIYFDTDSWELKKQSYVELEKVLRFLLDNPEVAIEISAHTDSRGSEEYNLNLSQKRAESVVNYLILNGISSQRLLAKGYGESVPVVPNDNEENMALNRRVEMRIFNK